MLELKNITKRYEKKIIFENLNVHLIRPIQSMGLLEKVVVEKRRYLISYLV